MVLRLIAIGLLGCLAGVAHAQDDPVFSGPQAGEKLPPLPVRVSGDSADEAVDLVAQAAGKPMMIVFIHQRTRPAFGLARALISYGQRREEDGLYSVVIFLSDDANQLQQWLTGVSRYFPEQSRLAVSPDGQEGPGSYGLNRNVGVTVLIANEGKVTANFALVDPSVQADGPRVAEQIVKLIGGKPPTAAELDPRGEMRNEARRPATADTDGTARRFLGPLIAKDASEEAVEKAAKALEDHAAKNPEFARDIGRRAKRIVDGDAVGRYGTERAQEYLKKWAKEWGEQEVDEVPRRERKKD